MDNSVLKKRLSTFQSSTGRISNVSDELLVDLVRAWESWSGSSKEFYKSIGLSKQKLATLIGKGKRLLKSGKFSAGEFKELKLEALVGAQGAMVGPIEMIYGDGRVIRFSQVEQLVDFMKKAA